MADTFHVGGHAVKKKTALIAVGGVVLIGGVYYYRQKQAASSAATSATDAGAADGSLTDPQTGYPYGSPEDQAALASLDGGLLPTQQSQDGIFGFSPAGENPIPGGFTSNAEWAQAAEAAMGSSGADAIAAALGKYLTGAPLTTDQITVVQEAIAVENPPPVASATGFPPSYHTAPTPPPGVPPPGKGKNKNYRQTADGKQSLQEVAKDRKTTATFIESTTRHAGIDAANLKKFNTYVSHGTGKKMPAGLVYYTANP